MKTGLVITTINNFNKNIKNLDKLSHKNKWEFNVIMMLKLKNFKFELWELL